MLTVFRRINKCPTSGQRFSDKFPTAGIDKKTNARGGGRRGGCTLGID